MEDKFKVPKDKISDFIAVFQESLEAAKLLHRIDDRIRIIDVTESVPGSNEEERLKRISRDVKVVAGDSCFMMMPFISPIGEYYSKIYEPAIRKAGLDLCRPALFLFFVGDLRNDQGGGEST